MYFSSRLESYVYKHLNSFSVVFLPLRLMTGEGKAGITTEYRVDSKPMIRVGLYFSSSLFVCRFSKTLMLITSLMRHKCLQGQITLIPTKGCFNHLVIGQQIPWRGPENSLEVGPTLMPHWFISTST